MIINHKGTRMVKDGKDWHELQTTKEVLETAQIENLSEDVRRRRWKFIRHIMRQGYDNDCRTAMTWAQEGRRRRGRPRTTWRRTEEKGKERAEWRRWSEVSTTAADWAGWWQCRGLMRFSSCAKCDGVVLKIIFTTTWQILKGFTALKLLQLIAHRRFPS